MQEAINRGIFPLSEVDEMLMMIRKRSIEETHPYVINCRKNVRFISTIRDDGKLKQILTSSEQHAVDKLYAFYFENKKTLTLNDLFPEWIEERLANCT